MNEHTLKHNWTDNILPQDHEKLQDEEQGLIPATAILHKYPRFKTLEEAADYWASEGEQGDVGLKDILGPQGTQGPVGCSGLTAEEFEQRRVKSDS